MRDMRIVPYDSDWPNLYEQEKSTLYGVFGSLIIDIQHFGSTSIKGMMAKPTIDVMVIVCSINEVNKYDDEMIKFGYEPHGEYGISGRRYFVRFKEDGENHAAHIHMYSSGNPHTVDELMFRDFLRIDRESFVEYEKLKKEISEKYRFSPSEYENAKSDCVLEIMKKAKLYYRTRGSIYGD